VRQLRAEVRSQLPRLHPQPELGQAAVAEVGALGPPRPARQLAIEEDRDAEAGDLGGGGDRLGAGGVAVSGVEPDQRADVERPDRRVGAGVARHVDRLQRLLGAGDERLAQGARRAGEREDAAVVVGVGVAVEQGDAAAERLLHRGEAIVVAPLGDVGNREQDRHRLRLAAGGCARLRAAARRR
jgi:hypothetical protein